MQINKFINFIQGYSQLLLTMPHSGTSLPDDLKHNLDLNQEHVQKTLRAGVDYCVPFVTSFHEYTNASKVWTTLPRVVVDVNRAVDNVDQHSVEENQGISNPHGLIWRSSKEGKVEDIKDLLTRPYTQAEFEELLDEAYHPYINTVREEMYRLREINNVAINFALHSMPNSFPGQVREGRHENAYLFPGKVEKGPMKDRKLPDIVLLDMDGTTCSPDITKLLTQVFQNHGLMVETSKIAPSSVTSPRTYIDPSQGLHFIGVEVVGHTFEPKRLEGVLEYNPFNESKYRAAFLEAFKVLEGFREMDL